MLACEHKWKPYTLHKAMCNRCGVRVPWIDLLDRAVEDAAYLERKLAEVAKAALKLRKKAETDGVAAIAYAHVANEHLDRLLAVLVEAGAVQT
jgi:hypothetical protein